MARYNQGMRLRPVKSIKHVVDASGTTTGGTNSIVDLIDAVASPANTVSNQVGDGATVHGIFISVEIVGAVAYAGVPRVYMVIYKNPGNNVAVGDISNIGVSDRRRFVLHQEMTMISQQASSAGGGDFTFPRTMFKGVVRLPRTFKRMGIDDKLQFVISNEIGESTGTTRWCIQCIYKEFR